MSNFLGPAWKYEKESDEWYLHLFSYKQPDLNWNNPKVRQEVADICNFWFEKGVDGFRCDVITYISKNDGLPDGKIKLPLIGFEQYCLTENYHKFIKELADRAWNRYDTTIVGEAMGITSENAKGYIDESVGELDCVFAFEHTNSDRYLQILPHKVNLKKLKRIFARWQALPKTCAPTLFWENHDQPRCIPRFVGYDCGGRFDEAAKMLAVALYMQRGVPFVYQGQEIGMTNLPVKEAKYLKTCDERENPVMKAEEVYEDVLSVNVLKSFRKYAPFTLPIVRKALSKVARDHARTPMQWTDGPNAGFSKGGAKLWMTLNPNYVYKNVAAQKDDPDSILSFYKRLIRYRLGNDLIINGEFNEFYKDSTKLYVYERRVGKEALAVICNFSKKPVRFRLPDEWKGKSAHAELCNYDEILPLGNREIRPFEAVVYRI